MMKLFETSIWNQLTQIDLTDAKSFLLKWLNLRSIGMVTLALGASFITYKTIRIYLLRRKYSHIPGPNTNGYF